MTRVVDPPFVAETLLWCNERRAEDGKAPLKKLPKGKRADGSSCPCGKASGWVVEKTLAYRDDSSWSTLDLPRAVTQFVVYFDCGYLPQYEAKP